MKTNEETQDWQNFISYTTLERRSQNPIKYQCPHCPGEFFTSPSKFNVHRIKFHGNKKSEAMKMKARRVFSVNANEVDADWIPNLSIYLTKLRLSEIEVKKEKSEQVNVEVDVPPPFPSKPEMSYKVISLSIPVLKLKPQSNSSSEIPLTKTKMPASPPADTDEIETQDANAKTNNNKVTLRRFDIPVERLSLKSTKSTTAPTSTSTSNPVSAPVQPSPKKKSESEIESTGATNSAKTLAPTGTGPAENLAAATPSPPNPAPLPKEIVPPSSLPTRKSLRLRKVNQIQGQGQPLKIADSTEVKVVKSPEDSKKPTISIPNQNEIIAVSTSTYTRMTLRPRRQKDVPSPSTSKPTPTQSSMSTSRSKKTTKGGGTETSEEEFDPHFRIGRPSFLDSFPDDDLNFLQNVVGVNVYSHIEQLKSGVNPKTIVD